ncbi:MAG: ATP-binding cassette domain-containing protein [Megasphaera sp.]|jgi:oligopeptide/dipeptide ABC transporter ATP-binding protein|uniref:ABC transporter ATP-binding protein n=1 Tax=Megasphaera sueciensis TaxID=349094 RepID=UPI003D04A609|nr:ATP-binding cassette domain-containing protein [Megasphaera sp.]MCI1822653.1 ATP-binding cassette domain-containing protein [Megasphaera sp.]
MTENVPILEVKHLKKYFPIKKGSIVKKTVGTVKAVDDLSFSLNRGETLGIVGESGCGKSTMGRCILRLLEPTSGEILFRGIDIVKLSPAKMRSYRRYIQIIFQNPYASLNPQMTVGRILEEPLYIHGERTPSIRKEKIVNLLKIVGLDESHYYSYPHEFSGGQRQRIAIARALVTHPDLIVADEAVSALDVSIQAQILNLMQDLQVTYGLTYIFISHSLPVIRHISTQIGVVYLGKMMEYAKTNDLFSMPLHPYTRRLLAAVPSVKKRRRRPVSPALQGIPNASHPPTGCVFHTQCPLCQEICKKQIPSFQHIGNDHWVACHYINKK